MRPYSRSIAANVALVNGVDRGGFGCQVGHGGFLRRTIVGMGDVAPGAREQIVALVAQQRAQAVVDRQEAPVECGKCRAHRRLFENGACPRLACAQRYLHLFARGDIACDHGDAVDHSGISETVATSTRLPSLRRWTISWSMMRSPRWSAVRIPATQRDGRSVKTPGGGVADRLVCGVAEETLGTRVPTGDRPLEVKSDDRVAQSPGRWPPDVRAYHPAA